MPLDSAAREILLPAHGWRPRADQMPLWRAWMIEDRPSVMQVAHRRWGKDEVALAGVSIKAMERVAGYWHMLPEARQARRAIWMALNPMTQRRRIDEMFPRELRKRTLDNEMLIEFVNGSTWQVIGSDRYDSLVGASPGGITYSEWAISNPASRGYLRPILAQNGGWELFITTTRGRNHAYGTYQELAEDGRSYADVLSADRTPVFTPEQLARERASYVSQYGEDFGAALFEQEYMCSWDSAIVGAYYGAELATAEREGRIRDLPIDPTLPVHDCWDIGRRDSTAIWFFQTDGQRLRFVDYYENQGKSAAHYAAYVLAKGYRRGTSWLPHDAKVVEWTAERSRIQTLQDAGLNASICPDHTLMDGINSARQVLARCEFDRARCAAGLSALRSYQKEWDEKLKRFGDKPLHDWSSHGADAFRYGVIGWAREALPKAPEREPWLRVGSRNEARLKDIDNWRERYE